METDMSADERLVSSTDVVINWCFQSQQIHMNHEWNSYMLS